MSQNIPNSFEVNAALNRLILEDDSDWQEAAETVIQFANTIQPGTSFRSSTKFRDTNPNRFSKETGRENPTPTAKDMSIESETFEGQETRKVGRYRLRRVNGGIIIDRDSGRDELRYELFCVGDKPHSFTASIFRTVRPPYRLLLWYSTKRIFYWIFYEILYAGKVRFVAEYTNSVCDSQLIMHSIKYSKGEIVKTVDLINKA